MNKTIRRGDIWLAEMVESYPYVVKGIRPVIILSNWKACNKSPLLNVVPITSNLKKLPSHVLIGSECGLDKESIAICEQITTINRENLLYQIGKCTIEKMGEIQTAINMQLGFENNYNIDMFQTVKSMLDELEELDRYLSKNYSDEIFEQREILLKDLNRYCLNHSISINNDLRRLDRRVREDNVNAV